MKRTPEHEAVYRMLRFLSAHYKYDKDAEKTHTLKNGRAFFSGSRNANSYAIKTLAHLWINRNKKG